MTLKEKLELLETIYNKGGFGKKGYKATQKSYKSTIAQVIKEHQEEAR